MRSNIEIVEMLRETIALIYRRPAAFGDANRVDASLWCFHTALAIALDCEASLRKVLGSMSTADLRFPEAFRKTHPKASESAVTDHVVKMWFAVSRRLVREHFEARPGVLRGRPDQSSS